MHMADPDWQHQHRQNLLRQLSNEYYDLNGPYIVTLDRPPSALEFSRLAHISRPVIIRGFEIPAHRRWSNAYLVSQLACQEISVAITPNGRADAVTTGDDGTEYFVEPYTTQTTMQSHLSSLENKDQSDAIQYLQSQNGNLYDTQYFSGEPADNSCEFRTLRGDVPSEIEWCSTAFDRKPDAVNLWIGDSRSVTSIHSDPYENIYSVIRGSKHFTLLPPTESWCLEEQEYPHASYTRSPSGALILQPSTNVPPVRWPSIKDPHLPSALSEGAHPIHITLNAGDALYLPAGWWHHVRQGGAHGEVTIAVNWWYDMEMSGMSWVWLSFLRGRENLSDNILKLMNTAIYEYSK